MNNRVQVKQSESNETQITYQVFCDDTQVGWINIYPDGASCKVYFEMYEAYRGRHYMRIALGKLTRELLDQGVDKIEAVIEEKNAMAIHVVEHNGYAWLYDEDGHRYYSYTDEETKEDSDYVAPVGQKVIYLCNGCFWGGAKAFELLDGVTDATVGYANGNIDHPRYEQVCGEDTGFQECIRVTYDPTITPLTTLMEAYFLCVDPTVADRQGDDIGHQYQAGVYYRDEADREILEKVFTAKKKMYDPFLVELGPLHNFYVAESYHQKYLDKHTNGYCHITKVEFDAVKALNKAND